MEYQIAVSQDGPWMELTVYVPVTVDLEKRITTDMREATEAHNLKDIFTDVTRVPNVAKTFEQYRFAYHDSKQLGLPRDSRIAVLTSPEDSSHDFAETVLQNAGFSCAFFQDKSEAYDWLRKKP